MKHKNYFIQPPLVTLDGVVYQQKYRSYSEYNYFKPGISSYVKTRHFEYALRLTKEYFYKCNAVDFGCADGIFLQSLAKYFNYVVGIDSEPVHIKIADKLSKTISLNNVKLICNNDLSISETKTKISDKEYYILYLLETLEHVGDKKDIYKSKIDFLEELFSLINKQGIIVISVPNMVGMPFLVQRLALKLFGLHKEPISMNNLLKAVFLKDTSDLEKRWTGGHLGFNHKKLENYFKNKFLVLKKKNLFFQTIYVIRKTYN